MVVPVLVETELFSSDAAAEALVKELSAAWPAARLAICAALVKRSDTRFQMDSEARVTTRRRRTAFRVTGEAERTGGAGIGEAAPC